MWRALAAGVVALVAWARLLEPRWLVVRRATLRVAPWPAALDGLRVLLIADLHAGPSLIPPEHVAARAATLEADLVLVLGDLVDAKRPAAAEPVADALAALRPPLGIFAVLGNHDWKAGLPRVRDAVRAAGIPVLENRALPAGERLWVAGVSDLRTGRPNVEKALAAVPEDAPVLLLTHHPNVFRRVPPRVALTVAGHTHGAQVNLPVARRLVGRSRYLAGHVHEDGRDLYVTTGIGTSTIRVRLGRRPELVLLELRAR